MFIDVNSCSACCSDSAMIQAAVDAAQKTGQAVVIPTHNARTGKDIWVIEKTIFLHSGSTIFLQNCHLRLADGAICNLFSNSHIGTPKAYTKDGVQQDITIRGIGKALLDGGIHNGLYEINGISRNTSKYPDHDISENCMMLFQNVCRLQIDHIQIKDQRYWGICLYTASNCRISNIHFSSSSNVPNQDGIDLLKGCHDIIIENITGCVGDNMIALLATDSPIYKKAVQTPRDGDIHNVLIQNLLVYGVGGCALIRLLNHDGYRIYNVQINNVIETSPWSADDAPVAQNPDLIIKEDAAGTIYHERQLTPGENGYRCEAAIIIGESYWYGTSKAQHGDTFGISVSHVMTHARYGLFLNNTLLDSSFDHIRMFGNGFMAVYFGEGQMENVRFRDIFYDKDCHPLPEDAHVRIDWNQTKSDGLYSVYSNGASLKNISFQNMNGFDGMQGVFGGWGSGHITCENVDCGRAPLSNMDSIRIEQPQKCE